MRWDSPWGWGAPGWHLECSVMSMALLGEHFDLHTGGIDHRELHHVNEIAQSEAYLDDGDPWVRYWMHNEFLLLNNAKIAKSAGPVPRLADLIEDGYHPMAYRLFLLGGHYRSQLDFTTAAVDGAQTTLRRLLSRIEPLRPLPVIETYELARAALAAIADTTPAGEGAGADDAEPGDKTALDYLELMDEAISQDLATPRLLAILQETLRDQEITPAGLRVIVAAADALLGLRLNDLDPAALERRRSTADLDTAEIETIERLIADRTQARKEKNWPRADEIRAELDRLDVQVTDTPAGPTWHLR
jgi:cysteinyl-tRNA synthetase